MASDLSLIFERPSDGRPIVWLISIPYKDTISPDGLRPYGHVRSVFNSREQAWHNPTQTMNRLLDQFCQAYRPGDFIAWQGGDSLLLLLVGMALMHHGIDTFQWLRFIGLDSYQVVTVAPFDCSMLSEDEVA